MTTRRSFLAGLTAAVVVAPAGVKAAFAQEELAADVMTYGSVWTPEVWASKTPEGILEDIRRMLSTLLDQGQITGFRPPSYHNGSFLLEYDAKDPISYVPYDLRLQDK